MGNTGACVACCHDITKRSPSVHVVSEEAYSGAPPVYSARADLVEAGPCEAVPLSVRDKDGKDGDSSAATESTAASSTPDVGQAQQVVKKFVRNFVKGQLVNVLAVNGGIAECVVSLDRKLTTLSLQRSGKKDSKKRPVKLEDICEICVGEEAEDVELALDERCVTLMLSDGNALGFRFADLEERDTFALCLSMFVDGRRGEMQRRKKEKGARAV